MALRLVEMVMPETDIDEAKEFLEENDLVLDYWHDRISEQNISVKIIVRAEKSQTVLDNLDEKFSGYEGFRIIVTNLEAVIPPIPEEEEEEEQEEETEEEEETASISREELYSTLSDSSYLSLDYLVLISLSAIVASIGVLRNDWAIVIGAMVIAPMIGPNMGLSLSTTLADSSLAKESIKTIFSGILAAFLISAVTGVLLSVDPDIEFIVSRTQVGIMDVGLALSSGVAGAIAFTRDAATALIGVMVSISLLPTLVVGGLLFGSGDMIMAGSALLLFLINLTCINLAGVMTFLVEGIKPKSWWKEDKAKKMTRWAVSIWITLLSLLIVVIVYFRWF